jgi:hypothetical protein
VEDLLLYGKLEIELAGNMFKTWVYAGADLDFKYQWG